jgi:ADP-ribose pyrophosphatase YjhB (NUDIX family)
VNAQGVIRYCPQCGASDLEVKVPRRDDKERQVCAACGYVHYVGPALAAGLVVHDRGRVLLVRRAHEPGLGKWTFPGGFVDLDEEPAAAALRETVEEASCKAEVERLVGVYRSEGPRGKQVVIVVYAGRYVGPAAGGSEEVREVRWFDLDDIPWDGFAFPSTAAALRVFLEKA